MQIVLFRHGIAEDRDAFAETGSPDSERPLTDKGRWRTRQAAAGLVTLLPRLDVLGTSPYVRARQTADVMADVCMEAGRSPERATVDAMKPGARPSDISRWLEDQSRDSVVALVGHEPDLSETMAWFTAGNRDGFARFKKAGACLIDFAFAPARGGGELLWMLTPAVLRRLAG